MYQRVRTSHDPSHRFALWAMRGGCTRGRKCACMRIRNLRGPFKKMLAEDARDHARRRRSRSPFRNHRRAESSLQTETHPDRSAHVREGERTGCNAASPHELQARERLGKAASKAYNYLAVTVQVRYPEGSHKVVA